MVNFISYYSIGAENWLVANPRDLDAFDGGVGGLSKDRQREPNYCRAAQATKATSPIPPRINKLTTSASSSFNRRTNSLLPHRVMLGANIDSIGCMTSRVDPAALAQNQFHLKRKRRGNSDTDAIRATPKAHDRAQSLWLDDDGYQTYRDGNPATRASTRWARPSSTAAAARDRVEPHQAGLMP
jgi:hypothetical protein